jgi:hypothetical protein
VKPGDHPDFFRLPAPPGRSRESTIRLDATGRFWHEGAPVTHAGMAQAFAAWIARHPDDGRYILTNGYDWTYFTVDDAPFFVRSARVDASGVVLALSDGSEEPLDPAGLAVGKHDALYCRVKGGAFEARFTPAAQTALAPLLVEHEDGAVGVELDGRRWRVATRAHPPPRRLPPTSPELLREDARPYFLWWLDASAGDLRRALQDPDAERRAYFLGALLREANTRDVWSFTSPERVRAEWPRVVRHLGRSRAMWAWLLRLPEPAWPPPEARGA